MGAIEVTYFSDVLCIWAYASQARVDAVKEQFGDAVRIKHQFCPVFGDTTGKITSTWNDRGGYDGFNSHLRKMAVRFPHIEVHPEIWLKTRPPTSASAHLFMKAVQQWDPISGWYEISLQRAFSIKCFGLSAVHFFETAGTLLSLIHISEPTRLLSISYAVFCLKKKKKR